MNATIAPTDPTARYLEVGGFTDKVFNPLVAWLTRRGLSLWGSRVLEVRGRTTGAWRSNPVNLLTHDGVDYLVAPRGRTQWVRNLRVARLMPDQNLILVRGAVPGHKNSIVEIRKA